MLNWCASPLLRHSLSRPCFQSKHSLLLSFKILTATALFWLWVWTMHIWINTVLYTLMLAMHILHFITFSEKVKHGWSRCILAYISMTTWARGSKFVGFVLGNGHLNSITIVSVILLLFWMIGQLTSTSRSLRWPWLPCHQWSSHWGYRRDKWSTMMTVTHLLCETFRHLAMLRRSKQTKRQFTRCWTSCTWPEAKKLL